MVDKEIKEEKKMEYEFEPPKNNIAIYLPLGIAIGLGLGFLFGKFVINNIGAGICFGAGIGMLIGFLIDILIDKIKEKKNK